jgi:hypothetical protein
MTLLASFNYYPPRAAVFAVASVLFLSVCVFIVLRIRSVWAGCGIGALSGGLFAGGAFFAGEGDMTVLIAPMMGACGAVVGAALGGACVAIGNRRRRPADEKSDGPGKT